MDPRRATTSTCRSRSTARPRRSTTASAVSARTRRRSRAMEHSDAAPASSSRVVVTRENASQLDAFKAIADRYGATLRLTRLRPSGRGADVWDELHPTQEQQRAVYEWLLAHGEDVLTGDSFFHLAAYGQTLPGLNLCGAGRVVCLIDPIGDVYACPFAIHDTFLAGNVRDDGFAHVWRESKLFKDLREPQAAGACGELQHVRRLPRRLHGGEVLHRPAARRAGPGVRARPRRARDQGRSARSRPRTTRRSRSPAAPATSRRSDGLVRVGRRGAAAGSPGPPEVRLQGDPRRGGARADLPGQHRRRSPSSASRRTWRARPAERSQATTIMGVDVSLPVLLSPTGVQAVHPDGELAVARAADARDAAIGPQRLRLASRSRRSSQANPKTFAQLYWAGSREAIEARVERARRGGREGHHRHARLDVLPLARLGLADDPERDRLQDDGAVRARGARCGRCG